MCILYCTVVSVVEIETTCWYSDGRSKDLLEEEEEAAGPAIHHSLFIELFRNYRRSGVPRLLGTSRKQDCCTTTTGSL